MIHSPEAVTAIILAGGFGTRIRHLLPGLPKPMAPVLGRPFLEWIVRYLAAQGIRYVIVSTGYRAESIEGHFGGTQVDEVVVRCVAETKPLGTAGGFLNATNACGKRPSAWLVLNGDSLVFARLETLVAALDDRAIAGAILGITSPDASRYGTILRSSSGELIGFKEKACGSGLVNAGVYLFRPTLTREFPRQTPLSFEQDVFPELIARQVRLKVCVTDAPFLDIGSPDSLPMSESFIRRHKSHFVRDRVSSKGLPNES